MVGNLWCKINKLCEDNPEFPNFPKRLTIQLIVSV